MYCIYSTIYGIQLPEKLNEDLQHEEVSELFDSNGDSNPEKQDSLKLSNGDRFVCCIPYSGEGLADLHFGYELGSTENHRAPLMQVTEEIKNKFEEARKYSIKFLKENWQELNDEFGDASEKQQKVFDELINCLETSSPMVYQAYSTS